MKITSKTYDYPVKIYGMQNQIDYYIDPKPFYFKLRISRLMEFLKPKKDERILDVGCGVGTFAFHSAKEGAIGYGIDYSKESIKMAEKIAFKYKLSQKTQFVAGNAMKMPFQSNFFDKVVCADFVEHLYIDETKKTIKEMIRVLRPGGLLVLYTPNRNPQLLYVIYQKLKRILTLKNPNKYNLLTPRPSHIGLKTPGEIKRLFENSEIDFKIILFARVINLSFPLLTLWSFISEKFFLTRNLLGERILLAGYKK